MIDLRKVEAGKAFVRGKARSLVRGFFLQIHYVHVGYKASEMEQYLATLMFLFGAGLATYYPNAVIAVVALDMISAWNVGRKVVE